MATEENHSKTSNVIKILNPMYPSTHDRVEAKQIKISNDPEKEENRNYEFTSEVLAEKEGYLSDGNPSSNSLLEDDQDLD